MENRLQSIYDAASFLFINKGYARTQIKDIAKQIGLSTGMIYVYFKGKKEILDFLLKCTVDSSFIERSLEYPIDESWFTSLHDEIVTALTENEERFSRPLQNGAEGYPFEEMLSDCYDTICRYGTGCLILEKNLDSVGKLGDYYQSYRREFYQHFLNYIQIYMDKGELRSLKYPELTCKLMIETVSWWAMHIMNDAFEIERDIDPAAAKEVCLDNLISAYKIR